MIYKVNAFLLLSCMLLVVMLLNHGCASDQPDPLKPTSSRTQVVEKKVVVACEIPKIHCDFEGKGIIPSRKLIECVKLQKEVIKICTEKNKELEEQAKEK